MAETNASSQGIASSQRARAGAVLYAKKVERVGAFYVACCGLNLVHAEDDHLILDAPGFELVIVAIPESIAASIVLASPPIRRQDTPIKLVFPVTSIDAARRIAATAGGELDPPEREWVFQGRRICDGHDPEGNVFQCRE